MAGAAAEASATTLRTVISGGRRGGDRARGGDAAAAVLDGFAGVQLDAEAHAAIAAALEACAARSRTASGFDDPDGEGRIEDRMDDPDATFMGLPRDAWPFHGTLEQGDLTEDAVPFHADEAYWRHAGAAAPDWAVLLQADAPARAPAPHADTPASPAAPEQEEAPASLPAARAAAPAASPVPPPGTGKRRASGRRPSRALDMPAGAQAVLPGSASLPEADRPPARGRVRRPKT